MTRTDKKSTPIVPALASMSNDESSKSPTIKLDFCANESKRPSSIHGSIAETIGETPLIKLNRLAPPDVNVYVKCESMNPGGSVKDRLALGVIEWAERNGHLKPGQTVIEATSGNTGIGLALVCAARGYPLVCVMPEPFSVERRKLMRFLGAKVVLTPPSLKGTGMVAKTKALAEKHGYYWPNQFENEANAWMHSVTTAPEILDAMSERNLHLDHFVCPYGTGGTINGISKVFRERSPQTKIHACEPETAPLIYSEVGTEYPESHPAWSPHIIQGWTPDFISKLVGGAVSSGFVDDTLHVGGMEAMDLCKELATKEGIFSGISGGASVACALRLAKKCEPGTSIVAMIADTGERYLSTMLFKDIPAEMNQEEKAIGDSVPSEIPPPPAMPALTPEAVEFVNRTNSEHKVVIWTLESCQDCQSILKFFDTIHVPYKNMKVDSFEFAKHNTGNKYRVALSDLTKCGTFPQLFIDGAFHGGTADACMKWKDSSLKSILEKIGLNKNDFGGYTGDAFEFLP